MLKNKKDLDNENRLENIKELLSAMKEFDNLESFLEHVSLATSVDQEWDGEKINMMTMHAAKGLEFDVVFLPGWEEGLFPHQKSIEVASDTCSKKLSKLSNSFIALSSSLMFSNLFSFSKSFLFLSIAEYPDSSNTICNNLT